MVQTGEASFHQLTFGIHKESPTELEDVTDVAWKTPTKKKMHLLPFLFQKKAEKADKRQADLPVFAASRQARRFALRILKHVQKYWLKFTKNNR